MGKVSQSLILADVHIPFHSKKSLELALDVGEDIGVSEVIILGDFADFYGVSDHDKDITLGISFDEEREQVEDMLGHIERRFKKAKRVYIEGNHEYRLERYAKKHAPLLYRFSCFEKIMNLDVMGYEYIPYGPDQYYPILGSNYFARHEPVTGKQGNVDRIISGHIHRTVYENMFTISGEIIERISVGGLMDKKHKVFKYRKNPQRWNHGFMVATKSDNKMFFENVIIHDEKICLCNGSLYTV